MPCLRQAAKTLCAIGFQIHSTKRIMKKRILKLLFLGLILYLTLLFNYLFIEKLIIKDPCDFHNDTNWLFTLFYDTPSYNGGHPEPSMLNYIVTFLIGAFLGYRIWNYLFERKTLLNLKENDI